MVATPVEPNPKSRIIVRAVAFGTCPPGSAIIAAPKPAIAADIIIIDEPIGAGVFGARLAATVVKP